jgi:glutamine amidotransferase
VGGAALALERLRERGLDQALDEAVRKSAKPMLGICLGLQMLADELFEDGRSRGLGWVRGNVVDLHQLAPPGLRVPHMGWNQVAVADAADPFFADIQGRRDFYFCHSFALTGHDPSVVAATTDYGAPVVAAIRTGTVYATQFHPEKSQINGQRLIEAFLGWTP